MGNRMSCAACAKNDICLLKKDPSQFVTRCPHGLMKECRNCKADRQTPKCPNSKPHGYCKEYETVFKRVTD